MNKSVARMRLLFQDEEFKARLFELAKDDKIIVGASCPAENCDGILEATTLSYMSKDFEMQFVNVLRCKCGFQFKSKKEDK